MKLRFLSKRNLIAWAGLLMLVLVIIAVSRTIDARADSKREARSYEMLSTCEDPLMFEDFIARFPGSRHVKEVRRRYFELLAEQPRLETLVMNATRDELRSFISNNPGRVALVQLAHERIDTMDWHTAVEGGSVGSMERYIREHPEGAFVKEANVQHQKYERMQQEEEARAKREAEERERAEAAAQDTITLQFIGASGG